MKHMKRDTYLSAMLTLTACLLTADLWTRVMADPPTLGSAAMAQSSDPAPRGVGSTAARAYEQRKEMVKLLKELNSSVKGLRADLSKGAIAVRMSEPASK